ncbi:hypothetical protein PPERSA_01413 [Pseudocohnilembus persalinus]|uniref:Uncharacterized protein n=1 Tax=Pseudocohnilembus persalinus TaxID=266149 RepID=A0A0V0QH65_PSEPJ|nr:hypothetical protein PPERSA_01413 [Pseudocohnilembus persalinus]|eukprot:KRX01510.1 hypothetical protein PPERSA_01413 [Pseudocohnilembus persalinus]
MSQLQKVQQIKESEKEGIIEDIGILQQRLKALDKSIQKKREIFEEYDRTLSETENAFNKISDTTKTLLEVVNKENQNLQNQLNPSQYQQQQQQQYFQQPNNFNQYKQSNFQNQQTQQYQQTQNKFNQQNQN